MNLKGASALVTGGASGLGLAAAHALAEAGANVVILDLPGGRGLRAAADIGIDTGVGAAFSPGDVRDPGQIEAALDIAGDLGDLRVVVNGAGIAGPGRVLSRSGVLPLADFERVIAVNLVGTFNVLRLAAARMAALEPLEGERGVIVNTASIAAFEGQLGQAAYAASKGGVVAMTLPVARDLAALLIRVVAIAPGYFRTPMFDALPAEEQVRLGATVPHPSRLGDPAEFGALVGHIVANPMLNGETIRLDGAVRLPPRLI